MTTTNRRAVALLLPIALLVAACGAGGGDPATAVPTSAASAATPTAAASDAMPPDPGMTGEPVPSAEPAASADPAASAEPTPNAAAAALQMHPWATATLTDVATGETFTIADLAGKPIFIESMAIWCGNCREQQGRFTEAFSKMAPGIAEYVVLTVEEAETAEELARYKADRGFTGRYAVAGKDVARALEAEFGPNAINPPAVPVVFVSATGEVSFGTGVESVDEIVEAAGV